MKCAVCGQAAAGHPRCAQCGIWLGPPPHIYEAIAAAGKGWYDRACLDHLHRMSDPAHRGRVEQARCEARACPKCGRSWGEGRCEHG